MSGEQAHDLLVGGSEGSAGGLVGGVEGADHVTLKTMGTPRNDLISGWVSGHHPRKRGSVVMSSIRNGVGSVSMAPSRPWVRA